MTMKGSTMAFDRGTAYLTARLYSDGYRWFYMDRYQQRVYLTALEMTKRFRSDCCFGLKTRVRVRAGREVVA